MKKNNLILLTSTLCLLTSACIFAKQVAQTKPATKVMYTNVAPGVVWHYSEHNNSSPMKSTTTNTYLYDPQTHVLKQNGSPLFITFHKNSAQKIVCFQALPTANLVIKPQKFCLTPKNNYVFSTISAVFNPETGLITMDTYNENNAYSTTQGLSWTHYYLNGTMLAPKTGKSAASASGKSTQ
ncbi:MAG: hypothetical protein NTU49_05585 [Gammaproteobacteria bacterium]|nr:hypothetical protein [Gammaproteobacteria bacterium]